MEKKLEVNNLRISFRTPGGKVQAVRNISFDLYKGETLAIVGESGSGKSVTNRAIIGISAGNAIIESGEIIYDGQDLLKITEEDFHKIRGDKIAMIFQDPMSSLNPIMRVGKQLTEAMILKNKVGRKNAKKTFNNILSLLNKHMNANTEAAVQTANTQACKKFDTFCINSLKLENAYNERVRVSQELKQELEEFSFLVSKHQKVNSAKLVKSIKEALAKVIDDSFVKGSTQTDELFALLDSCAKEAGKAVEEISEDLQKAIDTTLTLINEALEAEKINFFTLGYYSLDNSLDGIYDMPVEELNKMTRKYLDDNFMIDFINVGADALQHSHDESLAAKNELINVLVEVEEFFKEPNFTKKEASSVVKPLFAKVRAAIDKLEIVKNNVEYTFVSSMNNVLNKYYFALKNNPAEEKRFAKQNAKREALIAKGKNPDWKVVPASLIDLQMVCDEICGIIRKLKANYESQLEKDHEFNKQEKMVALVDFFKEQASQVVYKVNKKIAKIKALKLLEEVGIPEPLIRYRQYPFEFSGGMRQRIVIAIALAANPDILICDEPTTALDVTIQSQILELINKLKVERNLSVIFITHDLGVVANMADRIAVMYAGKIVEYGTDDDIFYDPRHPYTWALLSSMPDLDTEEKLEAIPGTPPNMIFPPKGDAFAARNKHALQIDFEEEPPLFEVSESHKAATWLLHPSAPKVEAPKIVTERIARMKKRLEEENNGK